MGAKATSFILGPELDAFVKAEVDSGEYATASEVVRAAMWREKRRKERQRRDLEIIDEGLASGLDPRSHEEIWRDLRAARAARKAAKAG